MASTASDLVHISKSQDKIENAVESLVSSVNKLITMQARLHERQASEREDKKRIYYKIDELERKLQVIADISKKNDIYVKGAHAIWMILVTAYVGKQFGIL